MGNARCVVKGCWNKKSIDSSISFHQFPVNKVVKEKWKSAIRQNPGFNQEYVGDENSEKYECVCCLHFAADDFKTWGKSRRLKTDAIPSIWPKIKTGKLLTN